MAVAQICWYLAAVVQTQLCKYFIEIGDTAREQTIWGEINALRSVSVLAANVSGISDSPSRFAMLTYGTRSPIGSKS